MLSYKEMIDLMIEDAERTQKWREEKPCCANCGNYYEEYGCDLCKYWEIAGGENGESIYEYTCGQWK